MSVSLFFCSISEAGAVTLGAPSCNLAGLLPSFLYCGGPLCILDTPWEAMGAAGRTREVWNPILIHFVTIWDPILVVFWDSEVQNLFYSNPFPGYVFCIDSCIENGHPRLQETGFLPTSKKTETLF